MGNIISLKLHGKWDIAAHLSSQFKSNRTPPLTSLKSKDKRRSPIEEIGTQNRNPN
jgi:hypothetical protein